MEKEKKESVIKGFLSENLSGGHSKKVLNLILLLDEISTHLSSGEIFRAEKRRI